MPSIKPSIRHPQVEFDLIPTYSREARDDEAYVMKAFARHASRCASCAHPYDVHKRGGTLCLKGRQRALDVAQYLYNKSGKAYSLVDREGNQRMQVEIPAGCEPVRGLLKAMERGLRLRREKPVTSFDPTYYVSARTIQPERNYEYREPHPNRKPRLETAEPPLYSRQHRREKPYYSGRGSLFDEDMRERDQYKSREPIYYHAAPRVPPPVPSKESSWH